MNKLRIMHWVFLPALMFSSWPNVKAEEVLVKEGVKKESRIKRVLKSKELWAVVGMAIGVGGVGLVRWYDKLKKLRQFEVRLSQVQEKIKQLKQSEKDFIGYSIEHTKGSGKEIFQDGRLGDIQRSIQIKWNDNCIKITTYWRNRIAWIRENLVQFIENTFKNNFDLIIIKIEND